MFKLSDTQRQRIDKIYAYLYKLTYILFLYGGGVIMALYSRHGYFDMMESKASLFNMMMLFLLPLFTVLIVLKIILGKNRKTLFTVFLTVFLLTALISTVLSFSAANAFDGKQGWYVGSYAMLCLVFAVLSMKDDKTIDPKMYIPLFVVFFFESIVVIFDVMDIHILPFKKEMNDSHFFFNGTIGNNNWCVGYFSLFVPFLFYLYLSCKERYKAILFMMLGVTGLLASILNWADSICLSYMFASFVLIPYVLTDLIRIRRFVLFLAVFFISVALISSNETFMTYTLYYDSIFIVLFEHKTFLCLISGLCLLFYVLSLKTKDDTYKKYSRYLICIVSVFYIVMMILAVGKTLSLDADIDSRRFELWGLSLEKFASFSLKDKLFGVGPELVRNLYARLYSKYGTVYTVSHSEIVQSLLTLGIGGASMWMLCWFELIRMCIQRVKNNEIFIGILMSLLGYLGQSFFNSATLLNLCILSILVIAALQNRDFS